MNTFGMKVSAAAFVEYGSEEELVEVFSSVISNLPSPVFHIGGGSNLLFTSDFKGTVLHSAIKYIEPLEPVAGEVLVRVGSGVVFDDFCDWAATNGLWGAENLSDIPGEVGASAVQNIGAYGVEVKDIIFKVRCFDTLTRKFVEFSPKECRYGYRDSIFKNAAKGRYVVSAVTFRLSRTAGPVLGYGHLKTAVEEAAKQTANRTADGAASGAVTPALVRQTVVSIRNTKLPKPEEIGSAGSFFKNPVVPKSDYDRVRNISEFEFGPDCKVPFYDMGSGFVKIPAAWLIEKCGWKGHREGNVGVYQHQPLVIVNLTGKACPGEIVELERKVMQSVKDKFGITLHPEVEHI